MEFPIYRKYSNHRSFFRIDSMDSFLEIKLTGSKKEEHQFEAKIHPDRVFIQDMIAKSNGYWEESSEDEFENLRSR